jgi:hypothetical protein
VTSGLHGCGPGTSAKPRLYPKPQGMKNFVNPLNLVNPVNRVNPLNPLNLVNPLNLLY